MFENRMFSFIFPINLFPLLKSGMEINIYFKYAPDFTFSRISRILSSGSKFPFLKTVLFFKGCWRNKKPAKIASLSLLHCFRKLLQFFYLSIFLPYQIPIPVSVDIAMQGKDFLRILFE